MEWYYSVFRHSIRHSSRNSCARWSGKKTVRCFCRFCGMALLVDSRTVVCIYHPVRILTVILFYLRPLSWCRFLLTKPYISLLRSCIIQRPVICIFLLDRVIVRLTVFRRDPHCHGICDIFLIFQRFFTAYYRYFRCFSRLNISFQLACRCRILLCKRHIDRFVFHFIICRLQFIIRTCNYRIYNSLFSFTGNGYCHAAFNDICIFQRLAVFWLNSDRHSRIYNRIFAKLFYCCIFRYIADRLWFLIDLINYGTKNEISDHIAFRSSDFRRRRNCMSEEIVIDWITVTVNHYFSFIDRRRIFRQFKSIKNGYFRRIFMPSCLFVFCSFYRTWRCVCKNRSSFFHFHSSLIIRIRTYIIKQIVGINFIITRIPVCNLRRLLSVKIENIVFHRNRAGISVPDRPDSFFDHKCVIVHLCISCVSCRIKRSHIFMYADVITERIIDRFASAEHNRTCRISVAVIILIICTVSIICIPRLSVSVSFWGI